MLCLHSDARAPLALAAALAVSQAGSALAHGFAGDRFFPATILTDDPYVADEMSLPTVTVSPPAPDGSQSINISPSISKRITPDIGVVLTHQWERLQPPGQPAVSGLGGTLSAQLQYQLFINAPHQAIALVGVNAGFGHTGRVQALGAPDFTTVSPLIDFGKGFGDLPESLPWLRPIAITGNLSFGFPTKTQSAGFPNPNLFNYGFAFEYVLPRFSYMGYAAVALLAATGAINSLLLVGSFEALVGTAYGRLLGLKILLFSVMVDSLEYLQHHVKDVGLSAPFDRMFPLVEVSFSTSLNRGLGGQTVGTIQPGIIWAGQYMQIGAEAIIPASRLTGHGYGGVVQLHFYLDDLFPNSIGRPLFRY